MAVQTRRHCLNLLRGFFKWAAKRQLVTTNPCTGVSIDREDGDEDEGWQREWYLTLEEQDMLLSSAPEGNDRRMIALALGTGIRLRELLCLHIEHVHADAKEPYIEVKYGSWDPGKQRFRPPKGRTGEKRPRIVPLFGLALEAIKSQLVDMPERNKYRLMFPSRWAVVERSRRRRSCARRASFVFDVSRGGIYSGMRARRHWSTVGGAFVGRSKTRSAYWPLVSHRHREVRALNIKRRSRRCDSDTCRVVHA